MAFANCSKLKTINFPACTEISASAFRNCGSLTSVRFPSCQTIWSVAFQACQNLSIAEFPLCTRLYSNVFSNCSALTSVSVPKCAYIGSSAFYNCKVLPELVLPSPVSVIGGGAFTNCYMLLSLYILGSSVPNLQSTTAFSSTPISNYTTSTGGVYGSIFVRESFYQSFITAPYWSVYSARIVSMTDAEIEALIG